MGIDNAPDWLLWQLVDSAFPAGGFAHSAGLEAAWQAGQLREQESLACFIEASLDAVARGTGVYLVAARREPGRLAEWDGATDLFLNNHVANRASRAQGQAFLRVAGEIFGVADLAAVRDRARHDRLPGHYAPVFGACAAVLGIGEPDAARLFIFISLRGLVSSAVRLGIVGPLEGQRIQLSLSHHVEAWAEAARSIALEDVAQTAPILDLLQGTQDRLYTRLFQS